MNTSLNPKAFWRDVVYLLIAKALKKRVVFQVHGGKLPEDFFAGNGILTLFLKWILRKSDAVVLLAEIEKEAYSRFVALERVLLIPNAVDLRYFENCPEKTFPNKQISAVYIGRLTRDKGVHEILDALDMLVNEEMIETVRVTLAGSGPDEPSLKRLVADRGLEPFVTFAGPVFDELKQAFWEEAELFLFPTYHEGLPYAVLESLASGTPVVTTAVGGIPDVVEEGRHGVFVPLRDAKALAEAIKEMIGDRERMRQMSAACRARAEEMYSLDRLSGQFSRLYTEIIG
nr:glycosyltransferase family 4 protein [Desulfuromonas sp.]